MAAIPGENVERPHSKSKSCIKLFLTVTTIFLLVATLIFIGLFLYYYIQFVKIDRRTESSISTTPAGVSTDIMNDGSVSTTPAGVSTDRRTESSISTTPAGVSTDTPTDGSICTTPDCVSSAALMLKNMNLSVHPCVDFYEFACGRFNREAPIPEGSSYADKFSDQIIQENELVMKEIITEDIATGQPKYLQKMKLYYKSCMDTETIEDTPLLTIVNRNYRQDWPTLNPDWSNSSFNLTDLIIRYSREYTEPLFKISVGAHRQDTTRKVIYVEQPQTLWIYGKNLPSEAAVVLGANRTTAEEDVIEVLALANALYEPPNLADFETVKVGNLSTRYPWVDLPGTIRAVFETVNITLSDDSDVIISSLSYMRRLNVTLGRFSNRVIQNYFGFTYALPRVQDMRYSLRGQAQSKEARLKTCLDKASKYFWKAMSKQFVARTFSNETKVRVEKMADNLKETFKQMLRENTWLSSSAKTAALKKLDAMTYKVGYPDTGFTDEDINREYDQYHMEVSTYYRNERLIDELSNKSMLSSLKEPVDKTAWKLKPFEINAQNDYDLNSMTIPAAFLQPPIFSPAYPDALIYGFVGTLLGHEITHGYDNNGHHFDDKGNMAKWFEPSDEKTFSNKTQCYLDQASNFKFDEVNMTLNGERCLGDIIADNGGLKASYRAYKALLAKKGENKTLPGLKLNYDQLFFLAFGQNWCNRFPPAVLKEYLQSDQADHPPGSFRIIGTLQNSEEFAKAYNCPRGSKMNPVKKCSVW